MINEAVKIFAPVVVLAVGVLGYSVFGKTQKAPQAPVSEPEAELVKVQAAERFTEEIKIEFDGLVIPYRRINLAAEISGQVTKKPKNLQAGSFVQQDAELLEIDEEFYRLEKERLEAEVGQADAAIEELKTERDNTQKLIDIAQEQYDLAQNDFQRVTALRERGAITRSEYEEEKKAVLTSKNALVTLENKKRQLTEKVRQSEQNKKIAEKRLELAIRDFNKSKLQAPISGLIVEDYVEESDYVQKGTVLFQLEDTSKVEISSSLKMEDFGWLLQAPQSTSAQQTPEVSNGISSAEAYTLPQNDVTVDYDLAGTTYEWTGKISRLAGTGLDPKTRLVPCHVTVNDPLEFHRKDDSSKITSRSPRTLMNGMFVQMTTRVVPAKPLLALPEKGVRPGNMVWISRNGQLEIETIEVVHRQDNLVLIHEEGSPIAPGEKIIVSQLAEPEEGMKVDSESSIAASEETP
ncbi:MAG: HlyD family efflux transporter periplasmic adaptor subunit [Planctomycetaceae bacterium]|nr:HlyD family efflux transporter periplasmic adaptor subunit [Planctomycetaceae bacterium]